MKKLAIIGAGDLGQLIAYHAQSSSFSVVGYYDDTKEKNTLIHGIPVIGQIGEVMSGYQHRYFDSLIIGIGYKHMMFRQYLYNKLSGIIDFANVIHPAAYIDPSCILGQGIFILPGCVLDRNVRISNNVLLNTSCTLAHDVFVGEHSFLAPAVKVAGFTRIGNCCTIGIGTTVIDNLIIGDFVQTGGGTVVIDSLNQSGLYVGVPAAFKRNNTFSTTACLL